MNAFLCTEANLLPQPIRHGLFTSKIKRKSPDPKTFFSIYALLRNRALKHYAGLAELVLILNYVSFGGNYYK